MDIVHEFYEPLIDLIDSGECPVGIFCDLSRAFDCVDHNLLLERLKNYGISDQEYAKMPDLFYQDNFDKCMLWEEKALYCQFEFQLQPNDEPNELWRIITNVSNVETNYDHRILRHGICVPSACPEIPVPNEREPNFTKALTDCYNKKFIDSGLNGTVSDLNCQRNTSKYPVDWFDILCGLLFIGHISLVFYSTYFEGVARYKSEKEYQELMTTRKGRIIGAFSLTRNWIRLKTVKDTQEIRKLRNIQGIRVYNTALVVCAHTLLTFFASPVSNTRYNETLNEKAARLFFSSGPLCVATFFFLSSFLLTNSLFGYMEAGNRLTIKKCFFVFVNRIFRLTPAVAYVILYHASWLRHLGNGPNWDNFVGMEYRNCRQNGWTNILYVNNMVDKYNMCLPVTWYLAVDTQYFAMSLLFIWFIKKNEKYIWQILGVALSLIVVASFIQNYYYDFTALITPRAEFFYRMRNLQHPQTHYQIYSFVGNMSGYLVGIGFGYYFYKTKNNPPEEATFYSKTSQKIWWSLSYGLGFSFVIVSGLIILRETPHDAFWASLYVATSRPIVTFALGIGILGMSEGLGWIALRVCQWPPTYVLGRLSFSAYIIHLCVILLRPALARGPIYVSDATMIMGFCGDFAMVYIVATLFTLFVELPVSEMQKIVFFQNESQNKQNSKNE